MSTELNPFERENLELFVLLGHEVAATALKLRADYVSAQLRLGCADVVIFTCDRGVVSVTGRGFEVELSRLREW
jgi:hypothetical protein